MNNCKCVMAVMMALAVFYAMASDVAQPTTVTPTLTIPGGTLSLPTTVPGTAGAFATFNISGSNLTGGSGNITITAPTDVEVSSDGTTFGPTCTVPYMGTSVSATVIYARLKGTGTVGSITGNISVAGGGATTVNQAVVGLLTPVGTVAAIQTANTNRVVTFFNNIANSGFSGTFGWTFNVGSADILVNGLGTYDNPGTGLLSSHQVGIWDNTGTLVASATIQNGQGSPYNGGYRFESTAATPTRLLAGQTYTIGTFYPANCAEKLIIQSPQTFGTQLTFGKAVQTSLATMGAPFAQPTLDESTYSPGFFGPNFLYLAPKITVTGGTTALPSTKPGIASASTSYTLSGSTLYPLTGTITATAPANVEISSDNITFSPSLTFNYSNGALASMPVYVRLSGSGALGVISGNIGHVIGGVGTPVNQAVSGTLFLPATTTTASSATTTFNSAVQNVTLNAMVSVTVLNSPVVSAFGDFQAAAISEGTVTFQLMSGTTAVGSAVTSTTVSNGAASVSYALPAGTAIGSYTINATYNGTANFATSSDSTQTLTVTVGPVAKFAVTCATTATVAVPVSATVTAQDAFGNTVTGYAGTVHLTSSDTAATLAADAKLTSGVGTFSVTFKTVGAQTITATDTVTSSITGVSSKVTVNPGATTKFSVVAPATASSGSPINVTITAQDALGNTTPAYAGTVHLTSTDAAAVLPADAKLTSGVGTFSVTLKTVGNQTVTGTDTITARASTVIITGVSGNIAVSSAPVTATASKYAITVPATATANTAFSITVTAQDATGNAVPTYSGTVHFTSSDASAVLPADAKLTNGVGTFSVTLNTVGSQTITATDTVTNTITQTSASIAVAASITIISGPNTAGTFQYVNGVFTVVTTSANPIVTWDFGDGTGTSTGSSVGHIYATPGTYTVTVTAKDPITGATVTQVYTVLVSGLSNPGASPGTPQFRVRRCIIKLNSTFNSIAIDGILHLVTGDKIAGSSLEVDVNAVTKTFVLNNRGSAHDATGSVQLSYVSSAGGIQNQEAPVHIALSGSDFGTSLQKGVTVDAQGLPKAVTITVTFNGRKVSFVAPSVFKTSGTTKIAAFGLK